MLGLGIIIGFIVERILHARKQEELQNFDLYLRRNYR
jgi:hypothetical protein